MNTKITLVLIAVLASIGFANGQASNEECMTTLSIFSEHAKVKNYDAAYEPLMKLRKDCPTTHIAIYSYGERVLKGKIDGAKTAAEKKDFANDLIVLYNERLEHFPAKTKKGDVYSDIGQAMLDYDLGTKQQIYDAFNKAYTEDKGSFKNPKSLYNYFATYFDLYNAGSVPIEKLFDKYEDVSEKFEEESKKLSKELNGILTKEEAGANLTSREKRTKSRAETNVKAFGIFSDNLDAIISKEATCENLVPLYQKGFAANKGNAIWLQRAASRMDAKECTSDPLFFKLVEAYHNVEPSAKSAYFLGKLADERNQRDEAFKFFQQSADLYTDSFDKAKVYIRMADIAKKRGSKSQSRSYAYKALKENPSLGKAYLLIATLYGSSANDCGDTTFNKKAVYWLAASTARRAGAVDASLRGKANSLAASYESRAPTAGEIFSETMSGKTVNIGCWIGSSVKVPNL
jgi:hypothetical protein